MFCTQSVRRQDFCNSMKKRSSVIYGRENCLPQRLAGVIASADMISAVIDCFVGDNEQAMRISNSFNAVMNSKMPEETPGRFDFIYFQEEQRGKLVLSGSPLLVSRLLQIADQLLHSRSVP